MAVLICAAAFAAYQIWDQAGVRQPVRHGHATAAATPGTTPAAAVTLAVTVTGAECQVFVRVPGGDILVNRSLVRGESVRFEEPQLSVVLGDGSAAQVYVNGKLRPPGKAGQRVAFVAARS